MRHHRLTLLLNTLLVLIAALLGIMTNYATSETGDAPALLDLMQKVAVPAIGVLILVLIVGHAVAFRLENPPAPRREWDPARTPYPGLEAFQEDEAAVFFGREMQIDELVRRLHTDTRHRFVVVAGSSGSGKSSLTQAGLIPRLRRRRWLMLPAVTPGNDPMGSLTRALGEFVRHEALAQAIERLRRREGRRLSRVLLLVDQLEELFTLSGEYERELFLGAVHEGLRADSRFWVVATVRIEFLRDFLDTPHSDLFTTPMALGMLTRDDLTTVIQQPGQLGGMRYTPGLVNRIVGDTGTSDALPLLAYLLQELYFTVGRGKTAGFTDYASLGGVAGAMSRQADRVVQELRGEDGIEPILSVLLRFVTTEGAEATRRRVKLTDLTAGERRIVDAFVDARLLVTDVANGSAIAQVTHEALFRQWAPLRQEVEAHAEQLRQRAELERWAADWRQAGRKVDYLLTGERLQIATHWLDNLRTAGQASSELIEFVDQSKRRDLAFLRRVSEGIGEHVLANAEQYPELAILLSLTALSECPPTPAATRALMAALAFSHLTMVLNGHSDVVRNLAWSPDGRWLATASRDGTARVWNCDTGACATVLEGHSGMVEMVAWSPDSTRVATASRDHTVRIWNAVAGETIDELTGADDVVRAVAWSPDGRFVAAGSRDRIVRIWDVESQELTAELRGHTDNILGIAFSPDGTKLATGSHDRTVRLWDIASRSAWALEGHEDFVEGVAWSPDGSRIASASGDQSARIWDIATGRQLLLIRGHTDRVWNVAWSPDGMRLATCGADHTARVWNPGNAEEILALRGHSGDVYAVVWTPDGTRLATASGDASARVWDVNPRGAEQIQLNGHRGPIRGIVYRPPAILRGGHSHEGLVITCADDRTVRLWDLASGELQSVLHGHEDAVLDISGGVQNLLTCSSDMTIRAWTRTLDGGSAHLVIRCDDGIPEAVCWAPDSRFATGGRDRMIRIWNATDGSPIRVLSGHEEWVVGLSWSASGRFLASASDDRTARLWDMLAMREITVLRGHDNWVDAVAWSPDERFAVTGSADRTARIWEAATGRQIAVLSGHEGRVHAVAWSPDGTRIATASYDRTVRIWDARTHTEIGVVGVHRDKVASVAWSADGSQIVTGSFDGTARVWKADVDLNALQAAARARVFRSLTDDERRAHLLPVSSQ
jgi:WD40 repeat protein